MMRGALGTANRKAKFAQMFSNNRAVNVLAAARIFLFAARDVWFVVGLPVFLRTEQGWSFWQAGAFLAVWVIGYGAVQASAPALSARRRGARRADRPHRDPARLPARRVPGRDRASACSPSVDPSVVVVVGLIAFGVVFALNSAVHSFLILALLRGRQGRDERRLLLHGQRRRPPRRHHPLRPALPVAGLEAASGPRSCSSSAPGR